MQTVTRNFARFVWCLCCVFAGAVAVQAQLLQASLRVQAEAVDVSGTLAWRVNMQFSPTDIVIDESTIDSELTTRCPQISTVIRDRILRELNVMAAEEKNSRQTNTPVNFYIDSVPLDFFNTLRDRINQTPGADLQFSQTNPTGFTAPTRVGETLSEHNWTLWTINFDLMVLAVKNYGLWLQTAKAAELRSNGGTPETVSKSMGEIADRLGIKSLSEEERAAFVSFFYAPDDLQRAGGTPRTAEQFVEMLAGAAYKAFLELRAAKMRSCTLRDSGIDATMKRSLEGLFTVYAVASDSFLDAENNEAFGVSGLVLIDEVRIKVTPQGNSDPERDKAIEELLNKKYKPRLLAQPGTIVTNDMLKKDLRQLYLVRSVTGDPKFSFANGVLTYEVERRPEISKFTLSGAGAYSPEDALNGTLTLTGDNLFHWTESISLNLTGGGALQQGHFNFSLPRETPKERRRVPIIFAGFALNASYFYDSSERLGNPPPTQLSNRESQISAKLSFEYDSFTDVDYREIAEGVKRKLHHQVSSDFGFDLQNTNLKSRGVVPLDPADGRVVYPSLNIRYFGSYDLRRAGKRGGIGEIDFLLNAKAQKGLTTFGADFDYRQYELSAAAQIFFGFTSSTSMFLRYERGAGASSNGTPLFRQFRLGGPLNVRGLEEGEFIGNSYAYDRTEFGVGLLPLLRTARHLFPRGKQRTEPATAAEPVTNIGGIDLANTYVKVYYDRGRIFETKSLGEILNPAHGVKGYGIAAELRGIAVIQNKRANLTIGYARSPDSLLRRRGVVVTGLSLDF